MRRQAASGATAAAIDLGAQSGRLVVGGLESDRLAISEAHRFANAPTVLDGHLLWDVLRIFEQVVFGLDKVAERSPEAASVAVTGWGLDYALLDAEGLPVAPVFYHRDPRSVGTLERALRRISRERIYAQTGTQFMPFNTLDHLLAVEPERLRLAERLLMLPNLFSFWLSGVPSCDPTIASTTQLFDVRAKGWAEEVLAACELPAALFPPVMQPHEELGPLRASLLPRPRFTAPPTVRVGIGHDTAAAVVGVPAGEESFAYISSGTWSLVGIESGSPVTSAAALAANLSNEIGVEGSYRILKNVTGMWVLSQALKEWQRQGAEPRLPRLLAEAERLPAGQAVIDVDHGALATPGDLPARIAELCRAAGEPPPSSPAGTVRTIVDSLACKYAIVLDQISVVTGAEHTVVHVVGGGSQNSLLCQATADVSGRAVVAGPVEASSAGNLLWQLRDQIGGLWDMRRLLARSVELRRYEPTASGAKPLEAARSRLEASLGSGSDGPRR